MTLIYPLKGLTTEGTIYAASNYNLSFCNGFHVNTIWNKVQKEQLLDSLFTKHLTGCPDKFLLTEKMFSSSLYTPKKFTLESIGAISPEQSTFWQYFESDFDFFKHVTHLNQINLALDFLGDCFFHHNEFLLFRSFISHGISTWFSFIWSIHYPAKSSFVKLLDKCCYKIC